MAKLTPEQIAKVDGHRRKDVAFVEYSKLGELHKAEKEMAARLALVRARRRAERESPEAE